MVVKNMHRSVTAIERTPFGAGTGCQPPEVDLKSPPVPQLT
jgi:hypothetical protein